MEYNLNKCSRRIRHSKYERNTTETINWWYRLFDMLESEAAIPPDRRLDVVNEIFPDKLLHKILSILSFTRTCNRHDEETPSDSEKEEDVSVKGSISDTETSKRQPLNDFPLAKNQIFDNFASKDKIMRYFRQEIGSNNPYTKFFRRREDRAAIWNTLPPLSFEEMNLSQKAETITTALAVDFVKWMEDISDEDAPTVLTVPLVLKMFEIGFNSHAAQSLQVRVKEMVSVPDAVALLKEIPAMAKRSQLHRHLQLDLKASTKKKKVFAFGTKLDKEHQVLPPKVSDIDKWLICRTVPQDIESMATVWQGITHLPSTRAYCEYLIDHPEIPRPKYLMEMNMLNREGLRAQSVFVNEGNREEPAEKELAKETSKANISENNKEDA